MKRALEQYKDFDKALELAREMVAFVLNGDNSFLRDADAGAGQQPAGSLERMAATTFGRSNKRWTPELDEQLRRMWEHGFLVKEIAARLGRSEASVNSRVRLLRLAKRRTLKAKKSADLRSVRPVEPA